MIGAMEKGMVAAQVIAPPRGSFEGVDLKILPKYICFRAALLQSRLTERYVIAFLTVALGVQVLSSRIEKHFLYKQLREKEYILAPGVQDFTPAAANEVTDEYVHDEVQEYVGELGNVSPEDIEEQYGVLSKRMSPELKVKFLSDADYFKARVKAENILEVVTVKTVQIARSDSGYFRAVVTAHRKTYINNQYANEGEERVTMVLKLMPPKSGRRWCLEITELKREEIKQAS